jgi:hypothetical protein
LGRYDGNVYPAIMEAAMRDPLNKESDESGVGLGYNESLKKLIVGGVGEYHGRNVGKNSTGLSGTMSRL